MSVLDLAKALISKPSVTPVDGGCQDLIISRLEPLGFQIERLPIGEVTNLLAWRTGSSDGPSLLFAGHTDVVPTGPLDQWTSDPFVPVVRDGRLYGRGSADMKSSIAAFVTAVEEFIGRAAAFKGRLGLLITSDEEGPSVHGTAAVCERLKQRGERLDFCIVGEPTSVHRVGDMVKNGRRGTLSGRLLVKGVQGHVAYPQLACNPIHLAAPAIHDLVTTRWDDGNAYYLPTSFQISNVQAGTGAGNVIPGTMSVDFNFRFSTESSEASLKERTQAILERHGVTCELEWKLGGKPFLTPPGLLLDAMKRAIEAECGHPTELSTTGGTSDGRFIAELCKEVVELGPTNATIHQINENIGVDELEPLKNIYRRVIEALLAT